MFDPVHKLHGRVDACRWSYERDIPETATMRTIVFARLALSLAVYDETHKPVTQATVQFGKPSGDTLGKLVGDGPHHLSVTMPIADLPAFAAAVQGPKPLLLDAQIQEGDRSVLEFRVISEGFV
jgi:hypothetical protein